LRGPVRQESVAGVRPCAAVLLPAAFLADSPAHDPVCVFPLRGDRVSARSAALPRRPRRPVPAGFWLRPGSRLRSLAPRRRLDVSLFPLVPPPQGAPPRLVAQLHLMTSAHGGAWRIADSRRPVPADPCAAEPARGGQRPSSGIGPGNCGRDCSSRSSTACSITP